MFLDEPLQADLSRRDKCKAPKIGTEPRVTIPATMTTYRCKSMLLRLHLARNISLKQGLRLWRSLSTHSVTGEEVAWRIRPRLRQQSVRGAMCLRPLQTLRQSRTSLDGPFLRPVVQVGNWDVLTRIRPMTLAQLLEFSLTQRTSPPRGLTSELLVALTHKN